MIRPSGEIEMSHCTRLEIRARGLREKRNKRPLKIHFRYYGQPENSFDNGYVGGQNNEISVL